MTTLADLGMDDVCLTLTHVVRTYPDDWPSRLVLADRLEEMGQDILSFGQRWQAWHKVRPCRRGVMVARDMVLPRDADLVLLGDTVRLPAKPWVWLPLDPHHGAHYPLKACLPMPVWVCLADFMRRTPLLYRTVDEAEKALADSLDNLKYILREPCHDVRRDA